MGGFPDRSDGHAKYCWPSSRIGAEEMQLLYQQKMKTGLAISVLVQQAVIAQYGRTREGGAVAATETGHQDNRHRTA